MRVCLCYNMHMFVCLFYDMKSMMDGDWLHFVVVLYFWILDVYMCFIHFSSSSSSS